MVKQGKLTAYWDSENAVIYWYNHG
jgi:hypothetical protein